VRTVKKGDQIARVALEVYGSSNSAVLDWIRKNNPQLRDLNLIDVGTQLTLPPLPAGDPLEGRNPFAVQMQDTGGNSAAFDVHHTKSRVGLGEL
jgi:phage tail protein X